MNDTLPDILSSAPSRNMPINISSEKVNSYIKRTKIKNDAIMSEIDRAMPEKHHIDKLIRP